MESVMLFGFETSFVYKIGLADYHCQKQWRGVYEMGIEIEGDMKR